MCCVAKVWISFFLSDERFDDERQESQNRATQNSQAIGSALLWRNTRCWQRLWSTDGKLTRSGWTKNTVGDFFWQLMYRVRLDSGIVGTLKNDQPRNVIIRVRQCNFSNFGGPQVKIFIELDDFSVKVYQCQWWVPSRMNSLFTLR